MRVVVVGAGPVGSVLATKLCDQGHEVLLIEQNSKKQKTHCSGLLSGPAVEFLEDFLDSEIEPFCFHDTARVHLGMFSRSLFGLRYGKGFASVDRVMLDKALLKNAISAGAILEERVFDPHVDEDCSEIVHTADVIVGADGPFSTVAKIFSFPPLPRLVYPYRATVEFEEVLNTSPLGNALSRFPNDIHLYIDQTFDGFFGWAIPSSDKVEIGCGTLGYLPYSSFHNFASAITHSANIHPQPSRPIPIVPRAEFYKKALMDGKEKHVFVIGDAAGHVKPSTGGGVYLGCRSALLLAQHIADGQRYTQSWYRHFYADISMHNLLRVSSRLMTLSIPFFALINALFPRDRLMSIEAPSFLHPDLPFFHLRQQILKHFGYTIDKV